MKSKKGFTLIEMLIVIAIIAVLVSIIIPVVGASTTKAAAAANAANLRSIEARLNIMLIDHPDVYNTILDDWGLDIDSYEPNTFIGAWLKQLMVQEFKTFPADANGTITLYAPDVVLTNCPSAKGLKLGDFELPEGTAMSIIITNGHARAYYVDYGVEFFAEIAETGKSTMAGAGGEDGPCGS